MVVAPDAGRVKVAERFSQHLQRRPGLRAQAAPRGTANEVEALDVVGEVEGRRCVLIDDMIDTAGTICAAAELLIERGAADVWAMATHGRAVGPRHRAPGEVTHLPGGGDQHPAHPRATSASRSSRSSRWPNSSPMPSTLSSRTPSVSEIFGGNNLA